MDPESDCLVRYGLMGHVGWFALDAGLGSRFERGQAVVIRTSRGMELGEVLVVPGASADPTRRRAAEDSIGTFRVLRSADADDLALGREVERLREARFDACRRIVSDAGWPLELIDVEPLLDLTTVLHYFYFGGDELDLGPVRARFRASCDFDVNFEDLRAEPAKADEPPPVAAAAARKGGCGDCDCGAGGCSTASKPPREAVAAATDCAETPHSGCSSCGVAALLKDRRRAPTAAS
ncbi:PSP1 C-terminal domain-containing protein [Paludisphaera borealis]|uniref:PSP1 C-terminal domain-containing protein n=1 Tax=Paludisphaera borealis TaxID=1387353 RepID=A0A1U7CTM2_9BACT|nr:PSP1 C-terminal domain-containing protein [Paludisphaera borealis]APW62284.1 hypothetical protein BSF38_03823 [Paludisphaera borealis]